MKLEHWYVADMLQFCVGSVMLIAASPLEMRRCLLFPVTKRGQTVYLLTIIAVTFVPALLCRLFTDLLMFLRLPTSLGI